jgi:protein-disulfide isomerase
MSQSRTAVSDKLNTKSKKTSTKSDKNNARRRMQAERARQERVRARLRRTGIGAAVVALVGAAIAIAIGTASGSSSSGGPVKLPANASGPGGTVIVYGDPANRNTLDVYEDFRCPYCDQLEKADGQTIQQLADGGLFKIQYHMGTFLDGNLGGDGSMKALTAAGAALNEGVPKFKAFHDMLYANQPGEQDDAFADTGHLLDLAARVPGLSTPSFVSAVRGGTYSGWAHRVSAAFDRSGVDSTPTIKLNGRKLSVFDGSGKVISPAQFTALVHGIVAS